MMRLLILAAITLPLAACGTVTWKRAEPKVPQTPTAQAAADEFRREAQARCGALGGKVRRDSDSDGSSRADWKCERPR